MIRPFAVLAVLAAGLSLGLGAAVAQEATTPAAPAVPAAPQVVVDPAASLNTSPKQANMLTGFYATQAVIELCAITIEPNIIEGMAADRARLEAALAMDAPTAELAYGKVKADVEKTSPDCAEGSADRTGVDAVTAIYAALPPPPAAPAATPAAAPAATPAPAPAVAPAQ